MSKNRFLAARTKALKVFRLFDDIISVGSTVPLPNHCAFDMPQGQGRCVLRPAFFLSAPHDARFFWHAHLRWAPRARRLVRAARRAFISRGRIWALRAQIRWGRKSRCARFSLVHGGLSRRGFLGRQGFAPKARRGARHAGLRRNIGYARTPTPGP